MGYSFTIINTERYHVSHVQRINQIYTFIGLLASVRKTDAKQVRQLKNIILDIEKNKKRNDLNINSISIKFEEDSDSYTVCWNHGILSIEIAEYAKINLEISAPNIHKPFDHKDNCNFSTLALSKLFTLERVNKLDIFYIYGKLCGDTIWIYLDLKFLGNHSTMSSFSQLNKIELFGLYHYIKSYLFAEDVVEYCEFQIEPFIHKEYKSNEKEFLHSIESKLPMDEVNRRIKLVENKESVLTRWGG